MLRQSRPTLLLTRPLTASRRFEAQARAAFGADLPVLISPLMAPVFYAPALPEPIPNGVIFTSETGVEALSHLISWRVPAVCVGPRTAEAARAEGWPAEIVGGDAEGLVAELSARALPGTWLHARGREAAGNLAGRLNAAGQRIAEAIVYAQEPQPLSDTAQDLLTDPAADVVVPLFSPRSASLFVQAVKRPAPRLRLAVISAAAARAAEPLKSRAVCIAPTPDLEGMLFALAQLEGISPRA